jgi:lysine 6-dehydrogenase
MLDLEPFEIQGAKIAPRDFLLAVIGPRLQPLEGDTDVCVMWNTVAGTKDGKKTKIDYYLWDEADQINGISSMARVTGFSASIGAIFLGRGMIEGKGIVAPEDGIQGEHYDVFLEELKKRDIIILETIERFD